MIKTSGKFTNIHNVEIEIVIKAPYSEWRELLDVINDEKWPGSKFHEYVKETLRKLERQVDVVNLEDRI